jgi:glycosyltransferase involved in cell wall biosynthesis|tara:strand:- start:162 stop:1148 length:987 start_codon:yes stop_codon:yes gene_type:complete
MAGIRKGPLPDNFITKNSLKNIAKLTGFECVFIRPVAFCPIKIFGIEKLLNWLAPIIPGIRWLSTAAVIVLRPIKTGKQRPSLSVIIPARNEKGNIENAVVRLNSLHGIPMEIIFVEGHSHDGTWEEILRVKEKYSQRLKINALKQPGKGKNDAVRTGFAKASCHLLTILDADLTTEPEFLNRFYEAYCSGLADFVNGNRLTLPMDRKAMRPLNRLGNIFFAKALSSLLSINISDSLCGTKLLTKSDYERFNNWREMFGKFDPFGDFELLFPAAVLCLGIIDIPVIYRSRTYGKTNIHRFRDGWMLLKMIIIGLLRIKAGRIKIGKTK